MFQTISGFLPASHNTFVFWCAGTLNPALQDRFGRPKRDISTIIHILNDLLCATPQYRAVSLAQEPPKPPASSSTSGNNKGLGLSLFNFVDLKKILFLTA